MKISLKTDLKNNYIKEYVVYSIYWGKSADKFQRLYNIYEPNNGLAGFDVLSDVEIDIIDSSLDDYVLVPTGIDTQSLIHKAVQKTENLYEALINHDDPENIEILFDNMRAMGLKP